MKKPLLCLALLAATLLTACGKDDPEHVNQGAYPNQGGYPQGPNDPYDNDDLYDDHLQACDWAFAKEYREVFDRCDNVRSPWESNRCRTKAGDFLQRYPDVRCDLRGNRRGRPMVASSVKIQRLLDRIDNRGNGHDGVPGHYPQGPMGPRGPMMPHVGPQGPAMPRGPQAPQGPFTNPLL